MKGISSQDPDQSLPPDLGLERSLGQDQSLIIQTLDLDPEKVNLGQDLEQNTGIQNQGLNLMIDIQNAGLSVLIVVDANIQGLKTDILDHGQSPVKESINLKIDIQDQGLCIQDQGPDGRLVQEPGIQMNITEANTADLGLDTHIHEIDIPDKNILGHPLGIQTLLVLRDKDILNQDLMIDTKSMMIDTKSMMTGIESMVMMIITTVISIKGSRTMIMNKALIRVGGKGEGDSDNEVADSCTIGETSGRGALEIWEGFLCLPILTILISCVNLVKWSPLICNT